MAAAVGANARQRHHSLGLAPGGRPTRNREITGLAEAELGARLLIA